MRLRVERLLINKTITDITFCCCVTSLLFASNAALGFHERTQHCSSKFFLQIRCYACCPHTQRKSLAEVLYKVICMVQLFRRKQRHKKWQQLQTVTHRFIHR